MALVLGPLSARAVAWGDKGHRVIAVIAEGRLSPRARKGVADLLAGQSLESVANWANLNRGAGNSDLAPIPLDRNDYDPGRDCCLIEYLVKYINIVSNPKEPRANRMTALKYVVHLVGDLHQPLHCIERNGDKGGERLGVKFFGRPASLHQVWDTNIVERGFTRGLTAAGYARQLGGRYQSEYSAKGTVVDWALESHRLARGAYEIGDGNIGEDYYGRNKPVVDSQLSKAGVRLAKVLNDIF